MYALRPGKGTCVAGQPYPPLTPRSHVAPRACDGGTPAARAARPTPAPNIWCCPHLAHNAGGPPPFIEGRPSMSYIYIASAQTRASTQAIQLGHDALPQDITHYRARRRTRRSAAPETKSVAPTNKAWTNATADMESSAVLGIAEVGAEGAGFTVSGVGAGVSPSEVPGVSGLLVSSGVWPGSEPSESPPTLGA